MHKVIALCCYPGFYAWQMRQVTPFIYPKNRYRSIITNPYIVDVAQFPISLFAIFWNNIHCIVRVYQWYRHFFPISHSSTTKNGTKFHSSKRNAANITNRFHFFFLITKCSPNIRFNLLFSMSSFDKFSSLVTYSLFPVSISLFGDARCCWWWCVSLFHFIFVYRIVWDGCYLWEV